MSEQSRTDQLCLFQYPDEVNKDPPSIDSPLSLKGWVDDSVPTHSVPDRSDSEPVKNSVLSMEAAIDSLIQTPKTLQISLEPLPSELSGESNERTRIFHLEQALDQALHYLDELNTRVKQQASLEEQVTLTEEYAYVQYKAIARLQEDLSRQKDYITQRNITIAALESDRSLTQTNLLSLQQDQLNLRQENAQWKNACQELQQECDRQHRKMLALEQENAAMQEQILQQARQSNEHETAVQYWKDSYAALQQELHDFQKILEERISSPNHEITNANISELLAYIQSIAQADNEGTESSALSPSTLHSFKIPDFLIRRYRHRGSGISGTPKD